LITLDVTIRSLANAATGSYHNIFDAIFHYIIASSDAVLVTNNLVIVTNNDMRITVDGIIVTYDDFTEACSEAFA
jgi:hypothetical protein